MMSHLEEAKEMEAAEKAQQEEVQLQDRDMLEIIYSLTAAGYKQHLEQLMPHLRKSVGFIQEAVTVIRRLVNAGHDDVAFALLQSMVSQVPQPGEERSQVGFFIRQLVRARRPPDTILQFCGALRESGSDPRAALVALLKAFQMGLL